MLLLKNYFKFSFLITPNEKVHDSKNSETFEIGEVTEGLVPRPWDA